MTAALSEKETSMEAMVNILGPHDDDAIQRGVEEIIDAISDGSGFIAIINAAASVMAVLSLVAARPEEQLEKMIGEFTDDARRLFAEGLKNGSPDLGETQ